MDPANLGGIVCEDPLAVEPPEELTVEMRCNIETFLPPSIQRDFRSAVRYFLVEMFRVRQKSNGGSRAPLRIIENGMPDATQRDAGKVKELEASREFVSRRLTRKMLKTVGSVLERHRMAMMDEQVLATWEFPVLPGSHLHMTNPPLEFVKFICAVFSLSKEHQIEVGLLKRNLLELIGVREFATEATFQNPCEPLKLSNVPCRHCDSLRDFDFCRDSELLPTYRDDSDGNDRPRERERAPRWMCAACGGEYDRTMIEFSLIEMAFELERRFAQQDLRCTKCKQIQSDNVSKHCQCSGNYQLTISKADVRRRLRTMVNVARVHSLRQLKVRLMLSFTRTAI